MCFTKCYPQSRTIAQFSPSWIAEFSRKFCAKKFSTQTSIPTGMDENEGVIFLGYDWLDYSSNTTRRRTEMGDTRLNKYSSVPAGMITSNTFSMLCLHRARVPTGARLTISTIDNSLDCQRCSHGTFDSLEPSIIAAEWMNQCQRSVNIHSISQCSSLQTIVGSCSSSVVVGTKRLGNMPCSF